MSHHELQLAVDFAQRLDALFTQMIDQQRAKCLRIAHAVNPRFTEDDMNDPHSFPDVTGRPDYAWEDGQLSAMISMQVAINRELHDFARMHSATELPPEGEGEF